MFTSYLNLGFEHILDPGGLDHVLFIAVLSAPFLIKDWKKVLILVTAFTIGHSITLGLASLNIIKINGQLIEILIAASIIVTALINLLDSASKKMLPRYATASIFGLIHGMGFSNFFRSVLGNEDIVLPLLAFNIGVELAQIIIVICILVFSHVLIQRLKMNPKLWLWLISTPVAVYAFKLILERI